MTHTDGLVERAPQMRGKEYPRYARRHGRIAIRKEGGEWWIERYRKTGPGTFAYVLEPHPTFAAAWEHADQLLKEQNR